MRTKRAGAASRDLPRSKSIPSTPTTVFIMKFVITTILVFGAIYMGVFLFSDYGISKTEYGTTFVLFQNGTKIFVEIADTEEKQHRGLSGRKSLPHDHGMLFVFDKPVIQSFWMPEMRFPLDIVWIDEHKKIIGVAENLAPLLDLTKPIHYAPPSTIKYALEVNAGFFQKNHISIGDTISL